MSYAPVAADIEVGESDYQATSWDKSRRMVVIRKRLANRPDPQMPLFTLERYSYQVIATNITDMPPEKVWEFYKGRAVIENRIEEVKNQFNLSKIPSSDYMANACYFQMVMLACDLTNWFRRLLLWGELRKAEVATLRRRVFTFAGKLVRHGRRVVLSLTRALPRQEMFQSVLARVGEVSLQIGQGQTGGGESAEPQGMRPWCRCIFDRAMKARVAYRGCRRTSKLREWGPSAVVRVDGVFALGYTAGETLGVESLASICTMWDIQNYSLLLDLQILWRTIGVVIKGKGAY